VDTDWIKHKLKELYPAFASMPEPALNAALAGSIVRTAPKGSVLFDENSPCQAFPMIVEGSVRVVKTASNGRELQLYRVLPGESCILSTGCILATAPYTAKGIAESQVTVVALPPQVFQKLLSEYARLSAIMYLDCSPNASPS
jgi:CRP/FNR family transcriptional regulator